MNEEFPNVSGLLLKGPSGVGKLEWCIELMSKSLSNQQKVVIVCVDCPPESIRERALKFDIDIGEFEGKSLMFIDCLSTFLGGASEVTSSDSTLHVTCMSNIEQIGMNIAKAINVPGDPTTLFFYTLSPLFLHNTPPVLMKFFQIVSSQIRERSGFGVFVLHDGVHDPQTTDTLAMMVDGVVEMRFNDSLQREIRIHHIKGFPTKPDWNPYDIGGETVDIVLSERIPRVRLLKGNIGVDSLL